MKKNLKEIITSTPWKKVEEKILEFNPEEKEIIKWYKKLYWDLNTLTPYENENDTYLEFEKFEEDEEEYYEDFEEQEYDYDKILETWKYFLGYYISEEIFKKMDKSEFLAHTIIDLTYGEIEFR